MCRFCFPGQDQSAGTTEPAANGPKRPRHPPGMFRVHKHRAGKRVQAKRQLRDLGLDEVVSFESPMNTRGSSELQ